MSDTYADYELCKIDKSENVRIQFVDHQDASTNWISITPETMARIAAILRTAPETGF
jgi:hypothetical protein